MAGSYKFTHEFYRQHVVKKPIRQRRAIDELTFGLVNALGNRTATIVVGSEEQAGVIAMIVREACAIQHNFVMPVVVADKGNDGFIHRLLAYEAPVFVDNVLWHGLPTAAQQAMIRAGVQPVALTSRKRRRRRGRTFT